VISAGKGAKRVGGVEAAEQGASAGASALTGTILAGRRDHSGLLEFTGIDDVLAKLGQIAEG
jgi:hypothetical protein